MPILTYVSRKLRIFGRPKRGFVQPLVYFAWKKLLYQPRMRPQFSRFFRPKHITTLPAQAAQQSSFQAGRTQFLYYVSRRVRAQVRPRRFYPTAKPPTSVFPWKRPPRPRIKRGNSTRAMLRIKRSGYVIPGPVLLQKSEWIIRARRRGKR
jgi:hypothetical protein